MLGMGSSELSDALNPYASQGRSPTNFLPSPSSLQPTNFNAGMVMDMMPMANGLGSHRSDFETVVSPQQAVPMPCVARPPVPPVPNTASSSSSPMGIIHELLRMVSITKEAQESERQRRLNWEQQYESQTNRKISEMETQIRDLQQEVNALKASQAQMQAHALSPHTASQVQLANSGAGSPHYSNMSAMSGVAIPSFHHPASPISPISQNHTPLTTSSFIQGSSSQPLAAHYYDHVHQQQLIQAPLGHIPDPNPTIATPCPSPHISTSRGVSVSSISVRREKRKHRRKSYDSSDGEGSSSSESSDSRVHRRKRVNGHDKRCLTIHHAMRRHILKLMGLENDKELPGTYVEGSFFDPGGIVRFVWDKTAKQSMHNAHMKTRIIADLKDNKNLYKHVPEKDFSKKSLDTAFDQCFTTLRQKFKLQRDEVLAVEQRKREDMKSQKARRLSRRKIKLTNRSDARLKCGHYEHVIFDAAFMTECMSSEESENEEDGSHTKIIRTRGYTWRSTRLLKFYASLDEVDRQDKAERPKRGLGKMERVVGPCKEGFYLPPKGISSWMICQRWIMQTSQTQPDFFERLKELVHDPEGAETFDWTRYEHLNDDMVPSLHHHHLPTLQIAPNLGVSPAMWHVPHVITPTY